MNLEKIKQVKMLDNFEEVKDIVNAHIEMGWIVLLTESNKVILGAEWPESYNMDVNLTVERKHFGVIGRPDIPEIGVI
ncbi:hypothetical protein EFK39_08780 [Lactococcus lactis subsp. lactis]|uniref:hypothetical protein n=1 Tax=Lactococcus lactis TaxID=1358 RepID=UPI00223AAA99|nr:hypothetical protein [Lactococcus lactis]MCT0056472.1 hypothetical protein [Lactococcus lactis subsp. lactis]